MTERLPDNIERDVSVKHRALEALGGIGLLGGGVYVAASPEGVPLVGVMAAAGGVIMLIKSYYGDRPDSDIDNRGDL